MIRQVTLGGHFLDKLDPSWPDGEAFVRDVVKKGLTDYSRAYRDDDGPLWAWGVVPMWEGVGSVWVIFDRRASRYVFRIVREARDYLEELDRTFKRLQGEIHEDAPTHKLARFLRFEREGLLRNYGLNGEGNFIMRARVN